MNSHNNSRDTLLWAQLTVAVGYGLILPTLVCLSYGWNWVVWMPVASIWLLINLPVIENWVPRLLVAAARGLTNLETRYGSFKASTPLTRLLASIKTDAEPVAELPR